MRKQKLGTPEYATPLTCGAQSSLIYFSQLLFYQLYQLRREEKEPERQKSLHMGLIRSMTEIIEALLDQILVIAMQFEFMRQDYCKECGIKEVNSLANISKWKDYQKKFNEAFPSSPLSSILAPRDLEALNMLFSLRNFISHGQPLRASMAPNEKHETIIDNILGNNHVKLLTYFKKIGAISLSNKNRDWTWDVLLQDKVFFWAIQTGRLFIEKLSRPHAFPLWQYVIDSKILFPMSNIQKLLTQTLSLQIH